MLTLWAYNISPYSAKVRAILRWKGIPFEEKLVHPLRRGHLKAMTGKVLAPVIVDGERAVGDSTAIVRYLDEKWPERPVLPADPVARGRALLLEEWSDEGLPHVVQPVRFFVGANFARTMERFRGAYPPGLAEDAMFRIVGQVLRRSQRATYGAPPATEALSRLAEVLDDLDAALGETGWLVGATPTVADFAVYGFLAQLEGLDGWEQVRAHKRVLKLVKTLGGLGRAEEDAA